MKQKKNESKFDANQDRSRNVFVKQNIFLKNWRRRRRNRSGNEASRRRCSRLGRPFVIFYFFSSLLIVLSFLFALHYAPLPDFSSFFKNIFGHPLFSFLFAFHSPSAHVSLLFSLSLSLSFAFPFVRRCVIFFLFPSTGPRTKYRTFWRWRTSQVPFVRGTEFLFVCFFYRVSKVAIGPRLRNSVDTERPRRRWISLLFFSFFGGVLRPGNRLKNGPQRSQ